MESIIAVVASVGPRRSILHLAMFDSHQMLTHFFFRPLTNVSSLALIDEMLFDLLVTH